MTTLIDKARYLLTGEPLRAISYGAVAVVWVASRILVATGHMAAVPDLDSILIAVTGAVAAVTEFGRRFTFSSNTVERVAATAAATGDPTVREAPP